MIVEIRGLAIVFIVCEIWDRFHVFVEIFKIVLNGDSDSFGLGPKSGFRLKHINMYPRFHGDQELLVILMKM